jgi:uncharacterized protein (UPF0333 family)
MKKLLNNKGNFSIPAIFIALFILLVTFGVFEYFRVQIIAKGTRDAMQTVITQSCTENYDKLYNGLREGYSGGYQLDKNQWTENMDNGNIESLINKQLGTQKSGNGFIKYIDDKVEFEISDLSVEMTNTPFAPNNTKDLPKFTGTAEYTLTVPLSFGWQGLPPMKIHMKAVSGYTAKF